MPVEQRERRLTARFAVPHELRYRPEAHVWVGPEEDGGLVKLGVTAPVRDVLAPQPEIECWAVDRVERGGIVATARGVGGRLVAIRSPVSGSVVEWNEALEVAPHALATQPYTGGWVARVHARADGFAGLVGGGQYRAALEMALAHGRDEAFAAVLL
jgi:glycine cleavage system H protein